MKYLPRIITMSLFVAVVAASWDVWWHGAVGRESFWIPPHLLLYLSVSTAIVVGAVGWWKGQKEWRPLALVLLFIPLSAPFDELWHRLFGVENIASIEIIWSPPHVVLALALAGSFLSLLRFLRKEPNPSFREFLFSLAYAGIFSPVFFLLSPLEPIGPHHLAGFWGALPIAALVAWVLLGGAREKEVAAGATKAAVMIGVLTSISYHGGKLAPQVMVSPHDHAPLWLAAFALLVAAFAIDCSSRLPCWIRGGTAGFLWAGILYGFSTFFFAPQFQYPFSQSLIAAAAGFIGGSFSGSLLFARKDLAKENTP